MCGICGYFKAADGYYQDRTIISSMCEAIAHRGIDGSDIYMNESVALGFNRLSIVGVDNGMQPVTNEAGTIILICNGEIYNYKSLKSNLLDRGHTFSTESDVEVILHLYEEYGTDVLKYINGQFAFAIYDKRKDMLFCARDHIGIAPFFYTKIENSFVFGSEIKAILKFPGVDRKVNLQALDQIFTFPSIICPNTIIENIFSLEPGHFLLIDSEGTIADQEYWNIDYPKENEIEYSDDENYYIERLNELLTKAVRERLQADVPVGFYISGGLDSSIIASKIYEIRKEQRHSFSVNFCNDNRSERPFQQMMAQYVNSIHHEREISIGDITDYLPAAVYHSESPLKETYNTASLMLSEMAHAQGIKVVLTGEGADELFAGYVGYQFDVMRAKKASTNPESDPFEQSVREQLWGDPDFFYEKDYYKQRNEKRSFYSDSFLAAKQFDCLEHKVIDKNQIAGTALVHKRSYIDLKLRLSEHLLAGHGDRAGLANSVEARYPFLDRELMEFARQIPPSLKLHQFKEKYILKQLAQTLIPEKIVKRPKYAFVAPGSPDILRLNREFVNDMLSYETVKRQGYFNPDAVEQLKKKYLEPGLKLNLPYDNDTLIIILTFNILKDTFKLPSL